MIVIFEKHATDAQIQQVELKVKSSGLDVHRADGVDHTVLGVVGDRSQLDPKLINLLPGVRDVVLVSTPYKLASREFHAEDTLIRVGNVVVGGSDVILIAGPCAVETQDQIDSIAKSVKEAGAQILRGGAFKPRS